MSTVAHALLVGLLTLGAIGAKGCEHLGAELLAGTGVRFLQPLPLAEARDRAGAGASVVLAAEADAGRASAAQRIGRDEPLPEALLAETNWILVTSPEADAAFALAARLSRAGARRVAVVSEHEPGALRDLAALASDAAGSAEPDSTP